MARNKLNKFSEVSSFRNVYENRNAQMPGLTNEAGEKVEMKGKWGSNHFKNEHPITLELACGRGEYSLGLGRLFPERNFIGVDIKGARIWQGAQIALAESLDNVAFLRTRIEQIELFFEPGEVDEIWITFPDPFLRESKTDRRLTSAPFLKRYAGLLKPGGTIHLKTDDETLYQFTLDTIAETQEKLLYADDDSSKLKAQSSKLFNSDDDSSKLKAQSSKLIAHSSKLFKAKLLYADDDIYSKPLPMEELALKTYYERMHLKDGRKIKYVGFQIS